MRFLTQLVGSVAFCSCLFAVGLVAGEDAGKRWPFFAFDNGVGRGVWQPEQQARVLADLGYDGMGYTGVRNIPAMLAALDAHGLKMYSTYVRVNLQPDQAPYDPGLPEAIEQLKGRGTALWLHVHGDPSPEHGLDDRAVQVLREIADLAEASELPVVLYPHTGFYVATAADAVRLVKQVDRDNVGASFNLCHFLKQHPPDQMAACLEQAMPCLFLVSINGADAGDTQAMGWDRLIQTLDRGSYKVTQVLEQLNEGGYRGPVGLQCYAIKGDIRDNLARSIAAWQKLRDRVD
jgi:sugar phosphate isomerase/epimerase